MKNRKYLVYFLVIIAAIAYLSWNHEKTPTIQAFAPNAMPQWQLTDLKGDKFKSDVLLGDVVIINFWNTTCTRCATEQAFLQKLYMEHENSGLKIVGISLDINDTSDIAAAVKQRGLAYFQVIGTGSDVSHQFGGIKEVPTTFIINRDGNIERRYIGQLPKDDVEKAIKELLRVQE